ncbi:hypothetical protein GIB67_042955 [Kingdonia uniflora]|uniref:Uncharacterized protein n=1 Tax=Kingdonia uniflora TaxID=39325 RepID=A0A7J7L646_9MAGN|nr:hypothetical protein GIB67_042955 [Kingdonia uniflora]
MEVVCTHYSALHWKDEQLSNSSIINQLFGQCCLQSKIKVPILDALPNEFQELYDGNGPHSRSFRRYMREYNAANAFTSLGVHMDDRVPHGRGPSSFVIHRELHHRIGALVPNEEREASYAQLYIYNHGASLNTHHKRNPRLNRGNPFSELYRHAYEVLEDAVGDNDNFNVPAYLHYSVSTDHRRYNLPSTDEIVVILLGDGLEISGVRDIDVYRKANQGLIQISECHPAYLPMHYVLLFPTGQLGWSVYLKHWNVAGNAWYSTKKLSQWEYYCYRLFQRTIEFTNLARIKIIQTIYSRHMGLD